MKSGQFVKDKWAVKYTKRCPCGNPSFKRDGAGEVCESCWNKELRYTFNTSGPFERRGSRDKLTKLQTI